MLTFDIETTGLNGYKDSVTCICFHDSETEQQTSLVFNQEPHSEDSLQKQKQAKMLLDTASVLCAFNGAKFDIPFLAKSWKIEDEVVGKWRAKLVDIFEASRLGMQITFSLNQLLATNGLSSKSGSGLDAIRLAQEGKWDALSDYCMQDVLLTHKVTTLPIVLLPKTMVKWSLQGGFMQ